VIVVIVCGGRDWRPDRAVAARAERWLALWLWRLDVGAVVHGDAQGADRWAADLVRRRWPSIIVRPVPVTRIEWQRYRKAAGPIRNASMIQVARGLGDLAAVLSLPGGSGTADMCSRAEAVGVPVFRFSL